MRCSHRAFASFVAVLLAPALVGCAGVDPEVVAAESRPAADYAQCVAEARAARARAPGEPLAATDAAVDALRRARAAAPADMTPVERRDLLVDLAGACFDAASLRSTKDDAPARLKLFEEAKNYAWEALLSAPAFAEAAAAKKPLDDATAALLPDGFAAPALLCAAAWGRASEERGLFAMMGDRARLKALADRALALDPRVRHGGPHRFFGAYWSKLPGIAGRDLDKSRAHFEQALAIAPDFLENRVLFVENYWLEKDPGRAADELARVLATPLDPADPDWLAQHLAQVRARRLQAGR